MLHTATTSKRIDSISPGRFFNRATFGRYSSVFMYSLQGTEANTYFVKLLFFFRKRACDRFNLTSPTSAPTAS